MHPHRQPARRSRTRLRLSGVNRPEVAPLAYNAASPFACPRRLPMKHLAPLLGLLVLAGLLAGCNRSDPAPAKPDAHPHLVDVPPLHNVYRVTPTLYSGSGPEGPACFAALHKLGVRSVLSVDGARPNVEEARRHGLRYAHLPVGYDGITREQALALARAARDLPGPVYLHCHHGKHRGPAAAAVIRLCLEDACTAADAVRFLEQAGTDPRYKGLYRAAQNLVRPTAEELAQAASILPEVAAVPALAQLMVTIDERWEHLKRIQKAGWKPLPEHPDLDPAHELRLLAEHYRESSRLDSLQQRPAELRQWLTDAAEVVEARERSVRDAQAPPVAREANFRKVASGCTQCHARYRDVPQER